MDDKLRLSLFGNLEVEQAGAPITGFRSNKALALLCYLAMTGRSHARPALASLLWGDLPETQARNNLSQTLANLNRLVGAYLKITRHTVAFNRAEPYWLDVECFQTNLDRGRAQAAPELLREAVELYRGDFLEGFYVRQAPAFEEWLLAQQAGLRELAVQALHTLTLQLIAARQPQAIDYITRLLAMEPWREETHRLMMLLLAYRGQRAAALAQYDLCRRLLAEELGVEPEAETVALYERIRAGHLSQLAGGAWPRGNSVPPGMAHLLF